MILSLKRDSALTDIPIENRNGSLVFNECSFESLRRAACEYLIFPGTYEILQFHDEAARFGICDKDVPIKIPTNPPTVDQRLSSPNSRSLSIIS